MMAKELRREVWAGGEGGFIRVGEQGGCRQQRGWGLGSRQKGLESWRGEESWGKGFEDCCLWRLELSDNEAFGKFPLKVSLKSSTLFTALWKSTKASDQ